MAAERNIMHVDGEAADLDVAQAQMPEMPIQQVLDLLEPPPPPPPPSAPQRTISNKEVDWSRVDLPVVETLEKEGL